jgi:hypothetical protein
VQGVVPRPDVAELLQKHFVAVAADADDPEPAVIELASKLEGAMMLPFVIFTDAEGKFLDGYSGVVTPPYLLRTLGKLVGSPS